MKDGRLNWMFCFRICGISYFMVQRTITAIPVAAYLWRPAIGAVVIAGILHFIPPVNTWIIGGSTIALFIALISVSHRTLFTNLRSFLPVRGDRMLQAKDYPGIPRSRRFFDQAATFISTGGYSGYARIVLGTVGSLVGLLLYLPAIPSPIGARIAATVAVFFLGVFASIRVAAIWRIKVRIPSSSMN